jgi:hypothetical protein
MRMLTLPIVAALVSSAADCPRSVTIEAPARAGGNGPIQEFQVRFHPEFKPGTFAAKLDGKDITGSFVPEPAPGGLSVWTNPPLTGARQKLWVKGDYTASGLELRDRYDSVTFSAPWVTVVERGTTVSSIVLREGQTVEAEALIDGAPLAPTTVIISVVGDRIVSLNNQPAGASVSVTIPTTDRRARLTVRGIRPGSARLKAETRGYGSLSTYLTVGNP